MQVENLALLVLAIGLVAFLYSSVGHAGASGYIAVMTLASLAPAVIKPSALVLNILVASIGSWQFYRAGHFRWNLFWPFALLSIPLAFLGGYLDLPTHLFKLLVGIVLLLSALYFFWRPDNDEIDEAPSLPIAIASGGVLGFFAGLTGTGGGIFLTPLLLVMRWARTKQAAATSALFILVNSIAGLAGNASSVGSIPCLVWPLAIAAVVGGSAGSYFGSRRYPAATIKRLLAAVLVIAGLKLLLTA
ncbi:MAG: sulfite exporter TauE/SafE family protein [Gammaproteobacteria bacterium]|nr:sulfite exporter TauE/SafE family protein [Gammaproteobacteria bacterium]